MKAFMTPGPRIKKPGRPPAIDLPGVVRIIKSAVTWEQLNLAPDAIIGLKNICQEFKSGQGLLCLFAGNRGVGQSWAAQAVANLLGMDLYRIDLAAVASKYIGETEKNLNRIFDAAEMADAVLFFDEADALFGKRTEVKDSHDRYANIDTNYLLQRIEAFQGLVILASNMKPASDPSLLRRVRHVIKFPPKPGQA
jgi:SpoVK/Ycf46/Vps4 family AAA+-type ATPase